MGIWGRSDPNNNRGSGGPGVGQGSKPIQGGRVVVWVGVGRLVGQLLWPLLEQ